MTIWDLENRDFWNHCADANSFDRFRVQSKPDRFLADDVGCAHDALSRGADRTRAVLRPIDHPQAAAADHYFGGRGGVRHWRQQELLDDNNDDFVLVISGNGGTTLSQRDRELALGAGEATLWSAAEAGWLSRATIDRFMALRVSRAAIVNLFSEADLAIMRRIPRSSPTLQLLTRYLDRMLNSDTLPLAAPLLTRHIIELIGAAIKTAEQQHGVREGTAQAARLDAIRADILQDLSKVQLSAKTIARKHGITARYVHLLFRQTGQTFGQFLEEARLRRAMALLNDPTHAKLRVGDIASLVGYAEHSSFHRAFRRYFGETPGRARKLSRRHARPYAID